MQIVLLSGGSGRRLWPMSNDIRSKQFLKLFRNPDGVYESMIQRVYRQIQEADPEADITLAASKAQLSSVYNQLSDQVKVCVEPCRRDTFPAIALSAAFLHDIGGVSSEEAVVICPVDPYVDNAYFELFHQMESLALESRGKLILMGIHPTYPSAKYGYIIPETAEDITGVKHFREKPDEETAEKYIGEGGLWNGGVFACRIGYILRMAEKLLGTSDYHALLAGYENLPSISFDYAVVEKEPDITVVRYVGEWKDLGTWNTLTEAMNENVVGNVLLNDTCRNLHVINEMDVPVLCMGLKDMVVSASHNGILVSDKHQSSYIRSYVDSLHQDVMYAEKSWGSYRILDMGQESLTIKVILNPGHRMNYHSHEYRNEIWNVVSGSGWTILDGKKKQVGVGDIVTMPAGCRHTVIAETVLEIVEIQLGKDISVRDKQKYDFPSV